jgi:hypothetical protein
MSQNSLYLVFLLVLHIRTGIIACGGLVRVEFFKIGNIIDIVGNFNPA